DEFHDVGMPDVENYHLRRAARLAAGLDDARERIEAFHERYRPRRDATARERFFGRANRRKVAAGARTPLEKHAFRFGEVEDGTHRVIDGIDETGGALRLFFDSAVEPHGRIEGHHLIHE